jgi:hypothetical protein
MAASMIVSLPGLLGALMFTVAGLIALAVFRRAVYPPLSDRHERLKLTQEQGRDPKAIARAVWLASLVAMPAAGYAVGHLFYGPIQGAT